MNAEQLIARYLYESTLDITGALDHMSQMVGHDLSIKDFRRKNTQLSLDQISGYDDIGSWSDWSEGELLDMDDEEREEEIQSFRGKSWAHRATKWVQSRRWPPIVIVQTKEYTAIGDGRGRISLAYGLGIGYKLPVIILTEK